MKKTLKKALDAYRIELNISKEYYYEVKLKHIDECEKDLADNDIINHPFMIKHASVLSEAVKKYYNFIKDEDLYNIVPDSRKEKDLLKKCILFFENLNSKQ